MIAVLDYDAGNIKSVEKALHFLGEEVKITRDREEILSADGVILPGVGAFGDAMEKLHQYGLVEVIREVVDSLRSRTPPSAPGQSSLPPSARREYCRQYLPSTLSVR